MGTSMRPSDTQMIHYEDLDIPSVTAEFQNAATVIPESTQIPHTTMASDIRKSEWTASPLSIFRDSMMTIGFARCLIDDEKMYSVGWNTVNQNSEVQLSECTVTTLTRGYKGKCANCPIYRHSCHMLETEGEDPSKATCQHVKSLQQLVAALDRDPKHRHRVSPTDNAWIRWLKDNIYIKTTVNEITPVRKNPRWLVCLSEESSNREDGASRMAIVFASLKTGSKLTLSCSSTGCSYRFRKGKAKLDSDISAGCVHIQRVADYTEHFVHYRDLITTSPDKYPSDIRSYDVHSRHPRELPTYDCEDAYPNVGPSSHPNPVQDDDSDDDIDQELHSSDNPHDSNIDNVGSDPDETITPLAHDSSNAFPPSINADLMKVRRWHRGVVHFDKEQQLWKTNHEWNVSTIPRHPNSSCAEWRKKRLAGEGISRDSKGEFVIDDKGYCQGDTPCVPLLPTECSNGHKGQCFKMLMPYPFIVRTSVGSIKRQLYCCKCAEPGLQYYSI